MIKFSLNDPIQDKAAMSFQCRHCATDSSIETTYDTYNRPLKGLVHRPGQCKRCDGTGFELELTAVPCLDCHGSGVCKVCDGKYSRLWGELPDDSKAEWNTYWEAGNPYPQNYAALASFYRYW
jgi:hypothetical protein